jgi:hypothetical protein
LAPDRFPFQNLDGLVTKKPVVGIRLADLQDGDLIGTSDELTKGQSKDRPESGYPRRSCRVFVPWCAGREACGHEEGEEFAPPAIILAGSDGRFNPKPPAGGFVGANC